MDNKDGVAIGSSYSATQINGYGQKGEEKVLCNSSLQHHQLNCHGIMLWKHGRYVCRNLWNIFRFHFQFWTKISISLICIFFQVDWEGNTVFNPGCCVEDQGYCPTIPEPPLSGMYSYTSITVKFIFSWIFLTLAWLMSTIWLY